MSSSGNKISPAVLYTVVIVVVILLISGLLYLLIRFLVRRQSPPSSSSSSSSRPSSRRPRDIVSPDALQRQLQQLFHLNESGLDQASIDALPVFLYSELAGAREPLDCAVCLCEFAGEDELRLLPPCGHAFHIGCIDGWLLSSSTCPLCRGSLLVSVDIAKDDDDRASVENENGPAERNPGDLEEGEAGAEKMVFFPVRLGKVKNLVSGSDEDNSAGNVVPNDSSTITNYRGREEGEPSTTTSSSSSCSLDGRRCYSMGSLQYVVAGSPLQLQVSALSRDGGDGMSSKRGQGLPGNSTAAIDAATRGLSGNRLCVGNRGESFSVSKIWQWSGRNRVFFSVRLGKFRSLVSGNDEADNPVPNNTTTTITDYRGREEGETITTTITTTSSSTIDERRCFSMGSLQCVVAGSPLQDVAALSRDGDGRSSKRRKGLTGNSPPPSAAAARGLTGKRLCVGSKGESFSVSKIWQWSGRKGKLPVKSDAASLDGSLTWLRKKNNLEENA